jgi:methionyl-tRNA formyltransferase
LTVWRARAVEKTGKPGEILAADKQGLVVAAGRGALDLLEIQIEGKKRMGGAEFLRGHRVQPGQTLGRD